MLKAALVLLIFPAVSGYALTQTAKECDLCVSGVTEFKVLYQDAATQQLISLAVKEICTYIPISDCYDYIYRQLTTFTTEVLNLEATQFCSNIGMCSGNNLHRLDKSVPCDFCKFIGDEIIDRLINKDNANKVVDIMDGVCTRLGPLQRICKEFVDNELKSMLYKAIDMVSFDAICKKAHLCSTNMNKVTALLKMSLEAYDSMSDDDGCAACKDGLGIVKKILTSSQLKDLVHIAVNELCDVAAADARDAAECKNITTGILDSIIDKLLPLFDVDSLCQQAGACPASSVNFVGDSEGCKACIDGLELVKIVLTSDEVIDLVNIAVKQTCMAIGANVETCEEVTSQILDTIIKNLVALFDPAALCQQANACPAMFESFVTDGNSRACSVCKDIFSLGKLMLTSNETKEIVGIGIDVTCEVIGVRVSFCKSFTKLLANKTLDFFMSRYNPEGTCSWMKLCKINSMSSEIIGKSEGCQACLDGLGIIKMLLTDPELIDLVHIAVNETCVAIGGDVATCESVVDDILDPLIENLVKLFNPQILCEEAGACLPELRAPNNDTCQACLDFAKLISIVINSKNFRDLIHVAIGSVCQIGGGDSNTCSLIITDIVDSIIDGLVPHWVPEEICHHSTEMCPKELFF